MKKAKKHILFWIKSSRGTNEKTVRAFPADVTKDVIKDALEQWCSNFGAWHVSDNYVSYGYRAIKMLPRRELLKKWDKICERKRRLTEEYDTLRAMLNANNKT